MSAQHKNDRLLVGAHTQRSVRLSPSPRPCLAWLETGCQSADLGAIIDIQLLGSTVPEWEQVCKSLGSKLGPELLKARTLQPLRLTQAWGRQAASKNLHEKELLELRLLVPMTGGTQAGVGAGTSSTSQCRMNSASQAGSLRGCGLVRWMTNGPTGA